MSERKGGEFEWLVGLMDTARETHDDEWAVEWLVTEARKQPTAFLDMLRDARDRLVQRA